MQEKISKVYPGIGFHLAPSKRARWIDPFNQLLEDFEHKQIPISRNRLIQILLEEALQRRDGVEGTNSIIEGGAGGSTVTNHDSITLSLSSFIETEKQLLQSASGQKIIVNLLKAMCGRDQNEDFLEMKKGITSAEMEVEKQIKLKRLGDKEREKIKPKKDKNILGGLLSVYEKTKKLE